MAFDVTRLEPIVVGLSRAGFTDVGASAIDHLGVTAVRVGAMRGNKSFEFSLVIDGMTDDQVISAVRSAVSVWSVRGGR